MSRFLAALLVALVLAACGGEAAPQPHPTRPPSATPAAQPSLLSPAGNPLPLDCSEEASQALFDRIAANIAPDGHLLNSQADQDALVARWRELSMECPPHY